MLHQPNLFSVFLWRLPAFVIALSCRYRDLRSSLRFSSACLLSSWRWWRSEREGVRASERASERARGSRAHFTPPATVQLAKVTRPFESESVSLTALLWQAARARACESPNALLAPSPPYLPPRPLSCLFRSWDVPRRRHVRICHVAVLRSVTERRSGDPSRRRRGKSRALRRLRSRRDTHAHKPAAFLSSRGGDLLNEKGT